MHRSSHDALRFDPDEFWTLRKYVESELAQLRTLITDGETWDAPLQKLNHIVAFLRCHFAIEERIMAEVGERNLEHHAAEHRLFLEELSALAAPSSEASCCLTPGICDHIDSWLRSHFVKYDTTLETTVSLVHSPDRQVSEDLAAYLSRVACFG